MDEPLKITCPCCKTLLIVDRKGKILEERKPILDEKETTGDRFEDAMKKARSSKETAEAKFRDAQQKEKDRMARLESMFNDGMKRVKDSGEPVDKPHREFDLD